MIVRGILFVVEWFVSLVALVTFTTHSIVMRCLSDDPSTPLAWWLTRERRAVADRDAIITKLHEIKSSREQEALAILAACSVARRKNTALQTELDRSYATVHDLQQDLKEARVRVAQLEALAESAKTLTLHLAHCKELLASNEREMNEMRATLADQSNTIEESAGVVGALTTKVEEHVAASATKRAVRSRRKRAPES